MLFLDSMPMEFTDFVAQGILSVIYAVYMLVCLAISAAIYVFTALSLYTIAKRRCIRRPWLAWIPLGSNWILGSISDQYQYVAKGKVKNKRKTLLALEIVDLVAVAVYFVSAIATLVQGWEMNAQYAPTHQLLGMLAIMAVAFLLMLGIGIAVAVIQYIALYDLYASCDPDNKVAFLLLNIFINVTQPILLFISRNKDRGMPPRKAQPQRLQETDPWENTTEA